MKIMINDGRRPRAARFLFASLILGFLLFGAPGKAFASDAATIASDVADPLFVERQKDLTLRLSSDIGNDFRLRQVIGYGFTDKISAAADIRYRVGNGKDSDGFSNVGIMGTYRAGSGSTGATDVLFGFGFGGQGVVPNYSDEVYSVGARTGKQWAGMTWAMTVMTNWIFDKKQEKSMAYIDMTPDVYFRVRGGWSLGLGATIRKATATVYDQEWLNFKIGSTIGRTGWFVNLGYEIESADFRIGGNINMLF